MAASSTNTIRVRLYFDYPPPAVSDCRMCWVLVDLNKCRVVADLESIIRDKFEFGRKNILNLFIEDCYLPHTESIYVVRDNDSIRVKVDRLSQVNGYGSHADAPSDHPGRKRRRDAADEEEEPAENGVSAEWRTKEKTKEKRKKKSEEERRKAEPEQEGNKDVRRKKKKEKKKRKVAEGNGLTSPKSASSTKAPSSSAAVGQPVKSTEKRAAPTPVSVNSKAAGKTQNVSSSDSSDSSSEEDKAPKKTPPQKPAPPKAPSTTPAAASKATPKPQPPAATKPRPPPPSSSSETDSSSDEAPSKTPSKGPLKKTPVAKPASATPNGVANDKSTASKPLPGPSSASQPATSAQRQTGGGAAAPPTGKVLEKPGKSVSDSSSSEEEIKLVIKRPLQGLGMGLGMAPGLGDPSWSAVRGRGNPRGGGERGRGGGREGRGRGGQGGDFRYNYDEVPQQPSYQSDALTNNSVVLQNPVEIAPKRDYSTMPMLAAPPPVGQKIAFKLLELTENYTPEVSEYKEGKIVSFDPTNKQIELELTYAAKAHLEPGKFDLVYENADGSATVEYAVSRGSLVTERWESLLEPRLII